MSNADPQKLTREQVIQAALEDYMDLFVVMQSSAVTHWLMFELTFAQARALILLAAHGTLTVTRLAGMLNVGKPIASLLVQGLVDRGLVSRSEDPADRRQVALRLSEKGAEIGAGRRGARRVQWQGWMERLGDGDLEALARGLRALRRSVRAEIAAEATTIRD